VFDPLLPDPLVDSAERSAFLETVLRYDEAGHAIWRKLNMLSLSGANTAPTVASPH
jgi:phenylacetic acid degradation operon negative regulatory protein